MKLLHKEAVRMPITVQLYRKPHPRLTENGTFYLRMGYESDETSTDVLIRIYVQIPRYFLGP